MNKFKSSYLLLPAVMAALFLIVNAQAFAFTPKEIYKKTGPGVVLILASEGSRMGSVGTGSIIREDGLIITNAHVFIKQGSSKLKPDIAIFLKPDRVTGNHKKDLSQKYKGRMVSYNIPLDLALVKIVDINRPLNRVDFAEAENVFIGDKVYAIGHPEQGGLWSLTTGVISAFRVNYGGVPGKDLFQTDASINRGNSGGPLLDEEGVMVGINSMIARKAADGLMITDVNFSIRSNVAIKWLNSLGYHFTAKKQTVAVASEPVKEKAVQPKETTPAPKAEPVKEKPRKETMAKPEPVKEKSVQPKPKSVQPVKPKEIPVQPEPKAVQPAKPKDKPEKHGVDKILTGIKPYKLTGLLRDMQEMEDMMDDMKGKVRKFKKGKN
ncbi:MAG: trypsin-like peptidase domain-containing protein [Desulfobacterales bacterium]|nr:trypsin-like peptidase domain-containing protein [Desulfobacterales bacterium]MDX2509045.1 trypsin-like peptidase domain-containing protein [Desulfobacterales bacterium]